MIETTAEASKASGIDIRYNYAALTLHGRNGKEYIIKMPYVADTALYYLNADFAGGTDSEMYNCGKGYFIESGYPENYFDIAEENLNL